ncbi:DUF4367 domain-containing protein [Bacillus sp. NPDC077411]|uniref:DUF4367 domain-containing protein n=1 Tax=Bacillus sp. NPDC077411 TaxID=3363947 RepID=UPI0037C538EF
MKKILFTFIICVLLFLNKSPINVHAHNIEVSKENFTINQLNGKTNFNLLIPSKVSNKWVVELKYPEKIYQHMDKIQIHYFDETRSQLKLAVIEKKEKEDFAELEDYGINVKIKDKIAVFHPLTPTKRIKDVQGGTLSWIQNGTLITLFSSRISKEELIKIAESMKEA